MKHFKHHGQNWTSWHELAEWLNEREPFKNSTGSFRGEVYDGTGITQGWLSSDDYWAIVKAEPDYLIYSYHTVMAWHDKHGWHSFDRKFSRTTTGHQHEIALALDVLSGKIAA